MNWYLMIMVLLCIPLIIASAGKRKAFSIVLPASLAILLFFMAFRAKSVGADTYQYIYGFNQVCKTPLKDILSAPIYGFGGNYELNFEYGYRIYNKIISFFGKGDQVITIANSLVIITLLGVLIKRDSAYPFLSIWLYLTLGVFQTQMNMSRNAIAILCCYLALNFIIKKALAGFIICVLIGALFHSSSILFIPLYWIINDVKLSPKLARNILIVAIICGLGFSLVRPFVIRVLPYRFGRYFLENTSKFEGLLVGLFHSLLFLFVWLCSDREGKETIVQKQSIGMWLFIVEIFFFCIGYDVASATRMAALFGPYMIIFIPNIIRCGIQDSQRQKMVRILVFVLTGIQFVVRLKINNIGGTMPYLFFWS